jgi:uncharacterized membrane protein YozB (DUF420 family)
MSSETIAQTAPKRPFAPYNKWDRDFFLLYVALIWLGIVMGFGGEMIQRAKAHAAPYPLIVHIHAVVFVSWLVLLTTQVLLIRNRRHDLHKILGIAGLCLAAAMLVLGPAAAIIMQRMQFGTPDSDPPFLAIQLISVAAFGVLVAAAFVMRGDPSAHKRLILLATLYISDAGFSRWLSHDIRAVVGSGFWPDFLELDLANDVLMLGIGAYDLTTRRRLHPAYVVGALFVLATQITVTFLYHDPAWNQLTLRIIGH